MDSPLAMAPEIAQADAVRAREMRFTWPGAKHFTIEVDAFSVARGERVFLLGPSGAGKSTLLSLICGIVTPQAGTVEVLGRDIAGMAGSARDRFRAEHFGVIFQMFNLLPYASALDNVLLPLSFAPGRRARVEANGTARNEARRLLAALELEGEHLVGGSTASLSVGQQQRVAVARALIGAPELIVADEPTSALDAGRQDAFLDLLFDQVGAVEAALIMVSHDERLAAHFDRAVRLTDVARIKTENTP